MRAKTKQRGVALITAVLVTALVAIAAVSLASRQFVDIRRTGNVMDSEQAYLYALGIEAIAKSLLAKYKQQQDYDDLESKELFQEYTFPVEGGVVSGKLVDLEAKFNLNKLLQTDTSADGTITQKINTITEPQLVCLLRNVMDRLGQDGSRAPDLAKAVADWIDRDEQASFPGGAEDGEYLAKEMPYRSGNTQMVSASELLLVEGFNHELLYGRKEKEETIPGLLEYVTVLPTEENHLNVNTAEALVIQCTTDKLDQGKVEDLIKGRPYKKADEFVEQAKKFFTVPDDVDKVNKALGGGAVTVDSQYYQVNITSRVGNGYSRLSSLLGEKKTGGFITVWRGQGTNGI